MSVLRTLRMCATLCAFVFCAIPLAAQVPLPDSVSVSGGKDCCFNFTVKNRHSGSSTITAITFAVTTPGADVRLAPSGPGAPANWTVSRVTADSIYYTGNRVAWIGPGTQLSGFTACFNNTTTPITVVWRTYDLKGSVSSGQVQLSCAVTCDQVSPLADTSCCFDWTIRNQNSAHSPINTVHMAVLTPGVTYRSTKPPTGWSGGIVSPQLATFNAPPTAGGLAPGATLGGMETCFDLPPTGLSNFQVRWTTVFNGTTICRDEVILTCAPPAQQRDTIEVEGEDNCCYKIKIRNRNSAQKSTDEVRLAILTPGVTIRPTPTAPATWKVDFVGLSNVTWKPTGAPLAPGATLDDLGVCVDVLSGMSTGVQAQWQTWSGGVLVNEDIVTLRCELSARRDSITVVSDAASCCHTLRLWNRHTPKTSINELRFNVLTPGASIVSVNGPWTPVLNGTTQVRFSGPGVAPDADLDGFQLCLDVPAGAPPSVMVQWETYFNGQLIGRDSLALECMQQEDRCDEVQVTLVPGADCCWDHPLSNAHTPQSVTNGLRLRVLTPDVVMLPSTIVAPTGWSKTATETQASFATTTNGIAPGSTQNGFHVCYVNKQSQNRAFDVEWTSLDNGKELCRDTVTLTCATVGVEAVPGARPTMFALNGHPNPFSGLATVSFDVPSETAIEVDLVDASGRVVLPLASGRYATGRYATTVNASGLAGGTYWVRLRAGSVLLTRMMTLVR
jgi:hypothetical protein